MSRGETSATQARELNAVDATVVVRLGPGETGGRYELFEVHATRGSATPAHSEDWDKVFYVLQGRIAVQLGDDTTDLGPGSVISIPAGTANTFAALTPSATFLAFSLGDGMGRFLADVDRTVPAGRPLEDVVPYLLEITERHGVTFAPPSGAVPDGSPRG